MKRLARIVVLAWMAAVSCVRWQPAVAPQVVGGQRLNHVRLTLRDSTRVELVRAEVRADSIVGVDELHREHARLAYAIDDVVRFQSGEFSLVRTVGLLVAIPVVVTALGMGQFLLFECCP